MQIKLNFYKIILVVKMVKLDVKQNIAFIDSLT